MQTKHTLTVATAFALWSAAAHADAFTETVIQRYQDMGFQFIEIKRGPSQLKVEAIMPDGRKVEAIYDRETGRILSQENERADADELGRSGVKVDTRADDFLDDDDDDENDEADDENDESDEADEDDAEDDEDDEDDDEDDGEDDDEDDEGDDSDGSDDSEDDED